MVSAFSTFRKRKSPEFTELSTIPAAENRPSLQPPASRSVKALPPRLQRRPPCLKRCHAPATSGAWHLNAKNQAGDSQNGSFPVDVLAAVRRRGARADFRECRFFGPRATQCDQVPVVSVAGNSRLTSTILEFRPKILLIALRSSPGRSPA